MTVPSWTLSFLRPYRGQAAAIVLLSACEIGLVAVAPWPMKLIVDQVLGGQPPPRLLASLAPASVAGSAVALLVVVAIAGLVIQLAIEAVRMIHTQMQTLVAQGVVSTLRKDLLSHLQALPLRHHFLTPTADSVYRLDADAYCVSDLILGGFFPLLVASLKLTVMFAILLYLDWTLALLAVVIAPALYLCLRFYSRTMLARAERVKELESKLVERVFETLSSIAVVKSFTREGHELARFSNSSDETMRARLKLTWQESAFSVAVTAITLAGTALVLVVGGMHVLGGTLTLGELLVVVAYLGAVYDPLSAIAHSAGSLQQAVASAHRVREIFALTPEVADADGGLDASGTGGHVEFRNVSFAYDPERGVLDRVSFEARRGELVALVGLTGAGKTTIASLIPRFFEPTGGSVLLDGTEVGRYSLATLREQVALVPQQPVLFSGTIADNIRYGRLDASDTDVEGAARAAHAHEFVTRFPDGYATQVVDGGRTLSGGERQRIGIARALLKAAPILILDEPTSAVDAISESSIFETLKELRSSHTTIVIAHRLSTIRDATRILVLDGGRLVAEGTHEDLTRTSELYRLMCARLAIGLSLDDEDSTERLMGVGA